MTKPTLSIKNALSASLVLRREKAVTRTLFFANLSFLLSFLGLFVIEMGAFGALTLPFPFLKEEPILWLLAAVLAFALSLFLLAPYWEGILSFCTLAQMEGRADFSAIHAFLVQKKLLRFAFLRGAGRAIRLILWSLFSLFVAYFGFGAALEAKSYDGIFLLVATALFLLFLLFLFLHLGKDKLLFNALLTKMRRNEAAGEGIALSYFALSGESAGYMRRFAKRLLCLFLRYLPLFFLSVLLLGIPLLFLLPRYLLARAALITSILNE